MGKRRSKPRRSVWIYLRQAYVRASDILGAYLEASIPIIIGAFIILGMLVFGLTPGLSDTVSILATCLISSVVIFLARVAARHDAVLIEISTSYLLHGGKALLDQMLGKMIAGRWRREEIRPGDALFKVLLELCRHGEWELRRRIAEALPMLGEINPKRTLDLVVVLREDWDGTKWRADLRRRAVEGLINPPPDRGLALIHKIKPSLIETLLQLRGNDDVFTAIAILEALVEMEVIDESGATRLREELMNFARKSLSAEQFQGMEKLAELLEQSKTLDVFELAKSIDALARSENIYIRVVAARNVWRLFNKLPGEALAIMEWLAQPIQHKYVRRANVKERSMEFITRMIKGEQYRAKAEALLRSLISDPDEIIRVTAFDSAEALKDDESELLKELCDSVIARETCEVLKGRAQLVLDELKPAS